MKKRHLSNVKKVGKQLANVGKTVARDAGVRMTRELKNVLEEHIMTKQEAKSLASTVLKELRTEADRFVAFAKTEYEREKKKAKPHLKKAVQRLKKGRK